MAENDKKPSISDIFMESRKSYKYSEEIADSLGTPSKPIPLDPAIGEFFRVNRQELVEKLANMSIRDRLMTVYTLNLEHQLINASWEGRGIITGELAWNAVACEVEKIIAERIAKVHDIADEIEHEL